MRSSARREGVKAGFALVDCYAFAFVEGLLDVILRR